MKELIGKDKMGVPFKSIDFPKPEWESLKHLNEIVTHRVDHDFNEFQLHDFVMAPWGDIYLVTKRKVLNGVHSSPYISQLTKSQIKLLEQYDHMALLRLKKCEVVAEN